MMIEAKHNYWARTIFDLYINRLLKKHFSHFYLLNNVSENISGRSLIITPNHISWWDGFFIDYLNKKILKRKIHLLMLEEQLSKYRFFIKVGAYSVKQNNAANIASAVKYTSKIVSDTRNMAVIYPQGEIEPYDRRPLSIKKGIKLFVRQNENILILPVGFKILFHDEKKPDIYARFGKVVKAENLLNSFEIFIQEFHTNLEQINSQSPDRTAEDLFSS